jgi:hypothetical protein
MPFARIVWTRTVITQCKVFEVHGVRLAQCGHRAKNCSTISDACRKWFTTCIQGTASHPFRVSDVRIAEKRFSSNCARRARLRPPSLQAPARARTCSRYPNLLTNASLGNQVDIRLGGQTRGPEIRCIRRRPSVVPRSFTSEIVAFRAPLEASQSARTTENSPVPRLRGGGTHGVDSAGSRPRVCRGAMGQT